MKRAFTLMELIVVLVILGVIAALLWPVSVRIPPENRRRASCQNQVKQIALSLKQYVQDFDEHYPPIALKGKYFGWVDALDPYVKSRQIFHCPAGTTTSGNSRSTGFTDYWYNARIARRSESDIDYSELTLLLGDGNDGTDATNARYAISAFPQAWVANPGSPLYRHVEGINFGFVDGHVKWFKASAISANDLSAPPRPGYPTFAIK